MHAYARGKLASYLASLHVDQTKLGVEEE